MVLAGCASTLGSMLYGALAGQKLPLDNAHVLSARPPYRIIWVSRRGRAPRQSRIQLPLVTLARGRYRNWGWKVRATPAVALSWRHWLSASRGQVEPDSQANDEGMFARHGLGWQHGFERLWMISRYLLNVPPLPMKITLILLPHGMPYHLRVMTKDAERVALPIVSGYPVARAESRAVVIKQFHAYMLALAAIGGQLARVELAAGQLAAPGQGRGRLIKDFANAGCFHVSAALGLAAGTAFKVPNPLPAGAGGNSGLVKIGGSMYKAYPHRLLAQEIYAALLLVHGMARYQTYEGLSWPHDGGNLRRIDALLGYCHAFVHYPGDIRRQVMPAGDVHPARLFAQGIADQRG